MNRLTANTQGGSSKCTCSWAEVVHILPCALSGLSQMFFFSASVFYKLQFTKYKLCRPFAESLLKGAHAGEM